MTEGRTFAHNPLVVIVPPDNPARVHRLRDLPQAARIVMGSASVPVGRYGRVLLKRAAEAYGPAFVEDVGRHVVSEETNVRLVRAKVELGEADAAIVYRTDALATDRVTAVPVPDALEVRARYVLGRLDAASDPELAERFVAYVASADGRAILEQHGFATEHE